MKVEGNSKGSILVTGGVGYSSFYSYPLRDTLTERGYSVDASRFNNKSLLDYGEKFDAVFYQCGNESMLKWDKSNLNLLQGSNIFRGKPRIVAGTSYASEDVSYGVLENAFRGHIDGFVSLTEFGPHAVAGKIEELLQDAKS